MPFVGQQSVFAISVCLRSLRTREVSAPGVGRYSLNVYDEILPFGLPLNRPAVLAENKKRPVAADAVAPPPPPILKQAPTMQLELILAIEQAAVDPPARGGFGYLHQRACLWY